MKTPKKQNKCPVCLKNTANYSVILKSVMPCDVCNERMSQYDLPNKQHEFTSNSVREGRRAYARSALQPRRMHQASREFIEAYPEEAKATFTEKEIKKAKYVYKGISSLSNWQTSK